MQSRNCSFKTAYLLVLADRFKDAWSFASALDQDECWKELAEAALHHLDIDMGK